jgi:UDP-2-acetamido-2,6-beta-L-arabino-hexul-4-ose reductase
MVAMIMRPHMEILVTGSNGFIGRNLVASLERQDDFHVLQYDLGNTPSELEEGLAKADIIFHLAGVNRPQKQSEFQTGNADFTAHVCGRLQALGRAVPIILSSSIQVNYDNPYGASKRKAEESVKLHAQKIGARAVIFRLKNVFGKWCRPNYNSVVATFCHNIAHDLPISISDPERELELIYIDDVVNQFISEIHSIDSSGVIYREVSPVYEVQLGKLADLVQSFREMRSNLVIPALDNDFTRKLYGTYLTYLESDDFAYGLNKKSDSRGCLAEFVKSLPFGQIFVSRTHPGITRGNHFHHTKAEKFLVVEGEAIIRFRHIGGGDIIEYQVKGDDFRVVDIPPGYTHSIENIGPGELITLFWASEIFDPQRPDTGNLIVLEKPEHGSYV